MSERVCESCKGKGWLLMFNTKLDIHAIERCDACEQYQNDRAAGDAAAVQLKEVIDE